MVHGLATAVACGLLVTPLSAGPAPAVSPEDRKPSQVSLRDGPGDVWVLDLDTEVSTRLDDFTLADVTRVLVAHRARAVVIRMRFVDLRRSGFQEYRMGVKTRSYHYGSVVISEPGQRAGRRVFWGDDGSTSCQGFTHHIDYEDDILQTRIPRACLGSPRWIRAGVMNSVTFEGEDLVYMDNPMNHEADGKETPRLFAPEA